MKLDFWFDLPRAILPLISESKEKKLHAKTAHILSSAMRLLARSMKEFQLSLSQVPRDKIANPDKLRSELKNRVRRIQAEKTELLCKAVQLSTTLFRSTLSEIDLAELSADKVQRVKLALKLVKVVSERAAAAKKESEGKQLEFFAV